MFCPECRYENVQGASFCARCGLALPSQVPAGAAGMGQSVPFYTQEQLYAGFWLRFVAIIIDGILIGAVSLILAIVIGVILNFNGVDNDNAISWAYGIYYLITLLGGMLYHCLMESSSKQATLGKLALGLQVCDSEWQRISFLRALGRHVGKILSYFTLYIGFMMAGFTEKKQGLHDLVAGCLVVKKSAAQQMAMAAPGYGVPQASMGMAAGHPAARMPVSRSNSTPVGLIVAIVLAVVALPVIGILAAIAIPAYQDYTVKAKMIQLESYASEVTQAYDQYFYANQTMPVSLEQAGVNTKPPVSLKVEPGESGTLVFVLQSGSSNSKSVRYVPSLDENNKVAWKCESDDLKENQLPRSCR